MMFKSFVQALLLSLIIQCSFCSMIHAADSTAQNFYVLTVPKSGSFLLLKLLHMLTGRTYAFPSLEFPQLPPTVFPSDQPGTDISSNELEVAMAVWQVENRFAAGHFNLALVSLVYYHWELLELEIGPSTFDTKLTYLINLEGGTTRHYIHNLYRNAEKAVEWAWLPNVYVCRFEDLVGSQGAGEQELQEEIIVSLANSLGIHLSQEKLEWIITNLFGNSQSDLSPTFREGKVGSWQHYFKPEHTALFEEKWGHLQDALGY
jgi:hypothetical protein